uniref:Colony stimulating factor 3 receptor n=1 Tax=Latimeria chalumnae TaxID=7897 RepID=H3BGW9_LATCH|nr:PREDICTED: granulocyte colony-stimulating factor receptor isoform X2 [Latimeria chalumnae]|eukprot:XP_005988833.1 PREDICTED: granulocyte colony-stimulating factor receptor isoform X2 [Latimeria chalumnae]
MLTQGSWRTPGLCFLLLLLTVTDVDPCGILSVEAPVVLLGSSVTASCSVKDLGNCSFFEDDEAQIVWKLDGETVPRSLYSNFTGPVSNLTITNFNKTMASLSCYLFQTSSQQWQLLGVTKIKAGYPPSKPRDLQCITSLPEPRSMTCKWDPGQETFLPTSFRLQRVAIKRPDLELPDCIPKDNQPSCQIGMRELKLPTLTDIWVTATNDLGTNVSDKWSVTPLYMVKVEPPEIIDVLPNRVQPDCVSIIWKRSFSFLDMECELQYESENSPERKVVLKAKDKNEIKTELCDLLWNSEYFFRIRCKTDKNDYWSDWSTQRSGTTLQRAPTGKVKVWWLAGVVNSEIKSDVQLLWKALPKSGRNGRILGYRVFYTRSTGSVISKVPLCNTSMLRCNFSVPLKVKTIYMKAYNSMGESPVSAITLFRESGPPPLSVQASPSYNHSLLIEWHGPKSPVTGYVIAWCMESERVGCNMSWQVVSPENTRMLLQGIFEPAKMYKISAYSLYSETVGLSVSTEAYIEQRAPSSAPKLKVKEIGKSYAELTWDPIPIDERNGFIRIYTLFYIDEKKEIKNITVDGSKTSCTVKGLGTARVYRMYIMASTDGGAINGTVLSLTTRRFEGKGFELLIVPLCLFLTLLSGALLMCYQREKLRNHLWPSVPDPANSTLNKWIHSDLWESKQLPVAKLPSPAVKPDYTVDNICERPPLSAKEQQTEKQLQNAKGSSESLHKTCHGSSSYESHSSNAQYAIVTCDGYRQQQVLVPLYVRSDSTQPLLNDMTPSPKPYENMWFHYMQEEDSICQSLLQPKVSFKDFPLLWGLEIEGSDEQSG